MPFAGYKNFKDCVEKNQDKRSPEGYCAEIMRKVEGTQNEVPEWLIEYMENTISTRLTKKFKRERQFDPDECQEGTYRTFKRDGKTLIGCKVDGKFKVQSVMTPRTSSMEKSLPYNFNEGGFRREIADEIGYRGDPWELEIIDHSYDKAHSDAYTIVRASSTFYVVKDCLESLGVHHSWKFSSLSQARGLFDSLAREDAKVGKYMKTLEDEYSILVMETNRIMKRDDIVFDKPVICASTSLGEARQYGDKVLALLVDPSEWWEANATEWRHDGDINLDEVVHQWIFTDEVEEKLPDPPEGKVWIFHGTPHFTEIYKSRTLKGGNNQGEALDG